MDKKRIHSWWDYICYVFKHDKFLLFATIMDILLLAWALWTLKADLSEAHSWILFIVVLINFIWQICNAFGHFVSTVRGVNFKTKSIINIEKKYKQQFLLTEEVKKEFSYIPTLPQFIEPKNIDELLECDMWYVIHDTNSEDRPVETLIHGMWPINFTFLNEKIHSGENFFNEEKLCLTAELFKDQNENLVYAKVCKGNYYNHYLSNAIYNLCLCDKNNGIKIWPSINAMNYPIPKLENSILSNHIGVSSLLVTKDMLTVLLVQNAKAAYNKNKIVPTCSGSVDYQDVIENRNLRENLRDVIIHAAERELREEIALDINALRDKKIKVETKIIGYYRDLSRGGKPEFCCVTEIQTVRAMLDIRPQTVEQNREIYASPNIADLIQNGVCVNSTDDTVSDTLSANIYFLKKYKGL